MQHAVNLGPKFLWDTKDTSSVLIIFSNSNIKKKKLFNNMMDIFSLTQHFCDTRFLKNFLKSNPFGDFIEVQPFCAIAGQMYFHDVRDLS